MDDQPRFLRADEAAERLGIQTASLYAYVSRGLLRSEPSPDNPRSRRYLTSDVDRLQRRQVVRRNPGQAVEPPLAWGVPVLDSGITLIDDSGLYYRGHDATWLAERATFEQVAALLWTGDLDNTLTIPEASAFEELQPDQFKSGIDGSGPDNLSLFAMLLPRLAASDLGAYDLRPDTVIRQGLTALLWFVRIVVELHDSPQRVAVRLQERWASGQPEVSRVLDGALVLCADHELNASSFTVRCIASTRAPLCAALAGGLSALMGVKHGAASLAVEAMFDEIANDGNVERVLAQRMRRGEHLPGFGHRVYSGGDPRCAAILQLLNTAMPKSADLEQARSVAEAALRLTGERPNLEFGLVALARAIGAPRGTALTIMALGRTVGWVAHALEEYARDELIRPRARYTGPSPH